MPTELSHAHHILIINGERVTGLSDDDPPVEFDRIPLSEIKWGQDGTMYVHGTARKGGMMTVKLLPTSEWAKKFQRWTAQVQAGSRLDFTGRYGDNELGLGVSLDGGKITEIPPSVVPNQTFEVSLAFERITPNADAAVVTASPV